MAVATEYQEYLRPIEIRKLRQKNYLVVFVTLLVATIFIWMIGGTSTLTFALSLVIIYGISGLALNYQVGQNGIMNFGVVGFFALGAYGTTITSLLGWHWLPSLIIGGMLFPALVTFLVSIPLLKLREDYFAIAVIALAEIIRIIFEQEDWLVYPESDKAYYGGTRGLSPTNKILSDFQQVLKDTPLSFNNMSNMFLGLRDFLLSLGIPDKVSFKFNIFGWFSGTVNLRIANLFLIEAPDVGALLFVITTGIFFLIAYLIFERIYNSPLGRLNKAIKDDELAVESLGYDVYKQKIVSMVLGALFFGLAGGLHAFLNGHIKPMFYVPMITFLIWTLVIVGGLANYRGVIVGALIVWASEPVIIQIKDTVLKPFLVALVTPITVALFNFLTDFINPQFKNLGLQLSQELPLKIHLDFGITLNFVIASVLVVIVTYWLWQKSKSVENERNKQILYNTARWLPIIHFGPFLLTVIPLYPKLTFDEFGNVTSVQFVNLATFFIELDPLLLRLVVLGFLLVFVLTYMPKGVIKEIPIDTINPNEEFIRYLERKKQGIEDFNSFGSEPRQQSIATDILEAEKLNKTFGGVVALNDVTITVKKGPLIGIIGPNGSGKSTLFNVLSGILEQDKNREGRIVFTGQDITAAKPHERALLGLSRTFQVTRLFPNLTVLENLLVAAPHQKGLTVGEALIKSRWLESERELHQRAFQILDFLNLLRVWNNKASEISGGQQKLVALGRALMSESKLILLDEPVAGVNPTLAKRIFEKISRLQQEGKQDFVIIEHNMDVQLSFCDYIYVMNKGEIVAEGTPEEILNNKEVIEAYLGH